MIRKKLREDRWADSPRVGRLRNKRRVNTPNESISTPSSATPRPQTPPASIGRESAFSGSAKSTTTPNKKSFTSIQAGKESREAKSEAIRWEKRIQLLSLQLYKVRSDRESQTRIHSARSAAAAARSSEELYIKRRSKEKQEKVYLQHIVTEAKQSLRQNIAKARMKLINSKKLAREVEQRLRREREVELQRKSQLHLKQNKIITERVRRERNKGISILAEAKSRARRENKWNAEERMRKALNEKEKWESKSADARRIVEELTIEIENIRAEAQLEKENYHPIYYTVPSEQLPPSPPKQPAIGPEGSSPTPTATG
eukprot:TRINITY_DN20301_c0_g1_i1.p1 TRINITY_DN20301_c0_g1~~TRINITY_DN20301_c0_g1_i1.p1  ORF type:complete len:326 (+),score=72.57 TRINITY_DN20301_c0_g1_i1:35-979(+)